MLSIAIVDDDSRCREEIAEAARVHIKTRGGGGRIMAFPNAASFLAEAETRHFDIAVLDIIMPGKSGLDAALELYARDHSCRIVFLTVSPDYAIHGYRVKALDYLLKPLNPGALAHALDACLQDKRLGPAGQAFTIILREGREAKKVAALDILYCQSEGRNVRFCGEDFVISNRGRLDEFKARLPGSFIQTHNRYLVNLDRVAAMTPEAMRLDQGGEVPISRAFRESASAAYFQHVADLARTS